MGFFLGGGAQQTKTVSSQISLCTIFIFFNVFASVLLRLHTVKNVIFLFVCFSCRKGFKDLHPQSLLMFSSFQFFRDLIMKK